MDSPFKNRIKEMGECFSSVASFVLRLAPIFLLLIFIFKFLLVQYPMNIPDALCLPVGQTSASSSVVKAPQSSKLLKSSSVQPINGILDNKISPSSFLYKLTITNKDKVAFWQGLSIKNTPIGTPMPVSILIKFKNGLEYNFAYGESKQIEKPEDLISVRENFSVVGPYEESTPPFELLPELSNVVGLLDDKKQSVKSKEINDLFEDGCAAKISLAYVSIWPYVVAVLLFIMFESALFVSCRELWKYIRLGFKEYFNKK